VYDFLTGLSDKNEEHNLDSVFNYLLRNYPKFIRESSEMAVGTALKILEKEGIFPVLMKKILMLT
jgi:hypothetical protein